MIFETTNFSAYSIEGGFIMCSRDNHHRLIENGCSFFTNAFDKIFNVKHNKIFVDAFANDLHHKDDICIFEHTSKIQIINNCIVLLRDDNLDVCTVNLFDNIEKMYTILLSEEAKEFLTKGELIDWRICSDSVYLEYLFDDSVFEVLCSTL